MTLPAALSGAALRVMRTAAGRRALQLVLLVGALFALGFLCGEQAHAAEGTPTVPSVQAVPASAADGVRSLTNGAAVAFGKALHAPARRPGHGSAAHRTSHHAAHRTARATARKRTADQATRPVTDSLGSPVTVPPATASLVPPATASLVSSATDFHVGSAAGFPARPATESVVRPGTDSVVRFVTERVVEPAGDLVTAVAAVTDTSGGARTRIPAVLSLPTWPAQPVPPSLPLPAPSGQPGLSGRPGSVLAASVTARDGAAAEGQPSDAARAASAVVFGPPAAHGSIAAGGTARVHHAHRCPHVPAHQAPAGDANGVAGDHSAADSSTSRHADAHAVTLNDRAPLRLVHGTVARADAAGTRDRHRDIPVFPG
ncbi:hypothetical protein ACJ6WE_14810 [Streptomyces sp. MMS24-I31]|uniref:hypothetical protein n=1 Tax=Streptomyces sp. MMS24-I31 TaxID=3351563 RepID=UPI003896EDED